MYVWPSFVGDFISYYVNAKMKLYQYNDDFITHVLSPRKHFVLSFETSFLKIGIWGDEKLL